MITETTPTHPSVRDEPYTHNVSGCNYIRSTITCMTILKTPRLNINLRITATELQRIDQLASHHDRSRSEQMRQMLRWAAEHMP